MNTRIDNWGIRKGKLINDTKEVKVFVIGSGIGGLSAAALLSKNNIKTYLAEKNDDVGGYFSSFIEDDSIFDYAVSYALSFDEAGAARQLIKELNLEEKLDIIRLPNLDKFIFNNEEVYSMPGDFEKYIDYLSENFPDEKENIIKFFAWLKEYYDGLKTKKVSSFIVKNFLKDFEPFIRSYFKDQKLVNILSMRIQADPSSLFIMGGFINECLMNGMYYVKGGYGELALALAESICEGGNYVGLNKKVTGIKYDEAAEKYEISFGDGERINTKYIIANISPFQLLNMMDSYGSIALKAEKLKKSIMKRKMGHSSINIYLKVKNVDLKKWNCGRIYVIPQELKNFDIFRYYEKLEAGGYYDTPILKIHIPSNYDDEVCGAGEDIIRVETDMCIDYFRKFETSSEGEEALKAEKDRILKYVLGQLDLNIDSKISSNLSYARVMVPVDFEKIMQNDEGSGTGWAHTVDNYFKNVFPTNTSIPNCYIVGQWGELGSGLRQLVLTGRKAAEDIIKKEKWKND